ncbi:hypothetical protein DICPUDRAFT_158098, partial [Dictyostelium purpureum]
MSFKFDPALLERRAVKVVEVDTRYRAPENLLAAASRKKTHSVLEDKPKVPKPRAEGSGERKPRSSSSDNKTSYKSSGTTDKVNIIKNPYIPIDDDDEEDEKEKKRRFIKPTTTTTTAVTSTSSKPNITGDLFRTNTPTKPTSNSNPPKATTTSASTSSSASSSLNKNKTTTTGSSSSAKSTPRAAPKPVEKKPPLSGSMYPTQATPNKNITLQTPGSGIMNMGNSGNTYIRKESYLDKYGASSDTSSDSKNILGTTLPNAKLTAPTKKTGPTIVDTKLPTATGGLKYSSNHPLNNGKQITSSSNKLPASNKRKNYSDDESDEDLFADGY